MKIDTSKLIRSSLVSLTLMAAFPVGSFAGWEVSGGDMWAIKFVKAGRMMAEDIPAHPACPLQKSVNVTELKNAIDHVEVSTTNEEVASTPGQIFVNRRSWPQFNNEKKLETVLKLYTAQTAQPFTGKITEAVFKSCFTSAEWRKNLYGWTTDEGDGNLIIPQDVAYTAEKLIARLNLEPHAVVLKKFDLCKLESAIAHTESPYWTKTRELGNAELQHCQTTAAGQKISLETSPISLKFGETQIKDGLNIRTANSAEVLINRSNWRRMSHGQRMELRLHEYLSIIGTNDRQYQISSLLYRDLPLQDYQD